MRKLELECLERRRMMTSWRLAAPANAMVDADAVPRQLDSFEVERTTQFGSMQSDPARGDSAQGDSAQGDSAQGDAQGISAIGERVLGEVQPTYVTADPASTAAPPVIAGTPWLGIDHDGVARVNACSGSLLWTGRHVLTAAHCVDAGGGSVRFDLPSGSQTFSYAAGDAVRHPSYLDSPSGFDVAVITLPTAVDPAVPRYDIFRAMDLSELGQVGHRFGYGRTGNGASGSTLAAGTKRYGANEWESLGLGSLGVGGLANNDTQLTYDFDNGNAANDAFGYFFGTTGPLPAAGDPSFDDVGLGSFEAISASGDSGSPTFVIQGGQYVIAGVASYIARLDDFGGANSDLDANANSTFGEFGVDARVAALQSFIDEQVQAKIVARHVFYNNSHFDDPDHELTDQDAIALDKQPLLPGETATAENVTSYDAGLNGILVDIRDLWHDVTAADFEFRVGNHLDPNTWTIAPTPVIATETLAADTQITRVTITWPDETLVDTWLEVRVKANRNTGLAAANRFYFGNLVGNVGDSPQDLVTDFADLQRMYAQLFQAAPLTSVVDINRDGTVGFGDLQAVFSHVFVTLAPIEAPAEVTESVQRVSV